MKSNENGMYSPGYIRMGRDKKHTEVLEMLYGTSSPMLVILVQENCRDFGIMDGYVCDRENHREMRFTQFIDVRGEDIFEKSVYI